MPNQKYMYTYRFQLVMPDKGEVIDLDEWRLEHSIGEFFQQVANITPWLTDRPHHRCIIERSGSDKVIDLMHDEIEARMKKRRLKREIW